MSMRTRPGLPQRVFMTADAVGGVWSYAIELARGLAEHGIDTQLAVLGPEPATDQIAAAEDIDGLSVLATSLPLDWTARSESELERTISELKRLARQFGADIVHLNAPALAGTSRWSLPVVASMHSCVGTWWCTVKGGSMPDEFVWRTRRTAYGMAVADRTIAPSRSFVQSIGRLYGVGVSVSPVLNGRRAVEQQPAEKKAQVFTAGRLWDEGKNVAVVDQAAAGLDWPVFAAGPTEGPNGARVEFANLRLLGTLGEQDIAAWYGASPIFVSVSRYEPFGLTVLEAAQAGAALVLSDIPTFRELWDGAARFVSADDSTALAEALGELADQPALRAEWGRRASDHARTYTAARMVEGTLDVYASVLSAMPFARAG